MNKRVTYTLRMMNQEKIDHYRDVLEKLQQELIRGIEKHDAPTDFGDDVDSLEEEGYEAEEQGTTLGVGETMRERLNEIDFALERLENGSYGVCEECKTPIEEAVLEIAPESRLCEKCKVKDRE